MREIKFKAWDKNTKQIIKDFVIRSDGFVVILEGDGKSGQYMQNDFELMQFTGLLDKNSVEIYEGDIVKWWHIAYQEEVETLETVEFIEGAFYPIVEMDLRDGAEQFEVIGNIYENAELIKELI